MTTKSIGIIINGATRGIATRQHLESSLVAIRDEGGFQVAGERVVPHLLLVGRNEERLAETARLFGIEEWTTSLDDAMANPDYPIFFDAAATGKRKQTLTRAIEAGKHIFSEKPVAPSVAEGLELLDLAKERGVRHGAVEDKLNLPGLGKLGYLIGQGFFGQILHFRLVFGWWVFAGDLVEGQRSSWNYKSSGGGGLILDMHPHWRYVIEGTLGRISRVVASAWTAIPARFDENGSKYAVDVEDSTSVLVELENGIRFLDRGRRAFASMSRCRSMSTARTGPPLLGFIIVLSSLWRRPPMLHGPQMLTRRRTIARTGRKFRTYGAIRTPTESAGRRLSDTFSPMRRLLPI